MIIKSGKFVNIPIYLLTRLFSMIIFQTYPFFYKKDEKPHSDRYAILIVIMSIISKFVSFEL